MYGTNSRSGRSRLDKLRQLVERQHAVDQEGVLVADRERAAHEAAQLRRHRRLDLEPDHRAAAAALEHGLELAHQIFGFFLDFDFAVADDAEGALPFDGVARKQPRDEQADGLLERDDARRPATPSGLGRRMKRSILFGMRISAFMMRPSLARASCSAIVKPRLGMNGNGCAGSMASGVSSGNTCCRK